jgi:hypothetical protein
LRAISTLAVTEEYAQQYTVVVGTAGLIMTLGYSNAIPTPLPTQPPPADAPTHRVSDPHDPDVAYFPETGHTLRGGFKQYWNTHGGLEQFGYPISEEYSEVSATDGKEYVTQWFERARMEWHPENQRPYDVLLGLLGREVTQGREGEPAFRPVPLPTQPGALYFRASGHTLAPELARYWQERGGLPVYGYPISEPFVETSKTDGRPYLVQYFERNRLEYHPESAPEYRVLLGLLGVDLLRLRGWLP